MNKNDRLINHILIGGVSGAGKTFLVRRLIEALYMPVSGFMTELDRSAADEKGMMPLYIYPASMPLSERTKSQDNLLGACAGREQHRAYTERFDRIACDMIESSDPDDLLIMDEIGFLESDAERFKDAVLHAFTRPGPILTVVKERYDVPFLNQVRSLPDTLLYTVTPENRDRLFEKIYDQLSHTCYIAS